MSIAPFVKWSLLEKKKTKKNTHTQKKKRYDIDKCQHNYLEFFVLFNGPCLCIVVLVIGLSA